MQVGSVNEAANEDCLAWLASDADSIPAGMAFLRLFEGGQQHLAELDLRVHPAERRKGAGSRLLNTADGSIAGFTELVIPGNGAGEGQHYGTGVLPEHRGHGLGRWMKAESIRQARQNYPDLSGLLADTADSNTHMRRINDGLGYTPTHTAHQYQLDLEQSGRAGPRHHPR